MELGITDKPERLNNYSEHPVLKHVKSRDASIGPGKGTVGDYRAEKYRLD